MSTKYQNYKPLVIRDNFLFVKGNPKGYETQGGLTGTSEIVGYTNAPGSFADVPAVIAIAHNFGEAAQPGNIRSVDVEVLFNYAGVTDITAGQSIAAIRGAINIASVTTLGTGSSNEYAYGVQGKVVLQGTANLAAGFGAALFGQYDSSGASCAITSGYHGPLVLDMGATSHLSSSAFLNGIAFLNTTACLINSAFKVVANASYAFDLTDLSAGGAHFIRPTTTVSSMTGSIAVLINGAIRYIPVYTS